MYYIFQIKRIWKYIQNSTSSTSAVWSDAMALSDLSASIQNDINGEKTFSLLTYEFAYSLSNFQSRCMFNL